MLSEHLKNRFRLQRRAADYRRVFHSEPGRRVLSHMAQVNFLLGTSVVGGDPQLTAFNEGRRAALLDILKWLRWTDQEIEQLTLERETDD